MPLRSRLWRIGRTRERERERETGVQHIIIYRIDYKNLSLRSKAFVITYIYTHRSYYSYTKLERFNFFSSQAGVLNCRKTLRNRHINRLFLAPLSLSRAAQTRTRTTPTKRVRWFKEYEQHYANNGVTGHARPLSRLSLPRFTLTPPIASSRDRRRHELEHRINRHVKRDRGLVPIHSTGSKRRDGNDDESGRAKVPLGWFLRVVRDVSFVQVFTKRRTQRVVDGVFRVFRRDGDMRDVYAVIREDDADESRVKAGIFWNDSND